MELLKGETLTARLTRGPLVRPLGEALRLGWQLASALSAAHAAGIVHRDLKPDNIMLIPDADAPGGERAKLLDFGIAKLIEGVRGDQPKTQSQVVMGTPQYMSPEQCKAARLVDEKTDVYALGTILFEMLAGRTPFVSDTAGEFIGMHLFKQPPRLAELAPSVPAEIAALVDSTLGKEKEGRPTMGQMVATLSQLVRRYGAPGQASEQLLAVAGRTDSPTIRFSSTLGRAMGQLTQPGQAGTRRWLVVGAVALLGLGGLAAALRQGEGKTQAPAVAPPTPSRPEVKPVAKPVAKPEAKRAHWSLRSTPPGAAVVDGDGKVLGRTPWEPASPACEGSRSLVLRLAGYADQPVTLDCAQDADRQEQLRKAASPSEGRPRPAQKRAPEKKIPDKIEYIE